MSETASLLERWESATLADLAGSITSGATPEAGNPRYYTPDGGYGFAKIEDLTRARGREIEHCGLQITDAAVRETAVKVYPAGTILLSMYGTIGLAKVCARPLSANQALSALLPPFRCDPAFLLHHLDYVRPQWSRYSGQTTQANINGAIVRAHEVPLPPTGEQVAIRQVLDTLDITIRQTEAIIEKLKQVKQGLLHDLLTRGIDANGELRPPQSQAPHLYKASSLGWIPVEWETLALGMASQRSGGIIQTGPFGSQLHAHEYVAEGVPVIMPQDIVDGGIDRAKIAMVSERKASTMGRHQVAANDVVFSRRGDLSRCAAIGEREIGWLCGTGCLLARLPRSELLGEWISLVYRQPLVQTQVLGQAVGSTMANLNTGILSKLLITRPPRSEQIAVVDRIAALAHRLAAEGDLVEKLRLAKSGLMDDLLTGRVRVTPLLQAQAD